MKSDCEKVELAQAFVWTCPECGTDHFERSILVELSPEEMQELRDDHNVEVWQQGQFVTRPNTVTCPDCNRNYATASLESDD